MLDTDFLSSLGLMVVFAAIFALGGKAVRMPSIVVFLLAGLVLGPITGLVTLSHALELISETGIALLLFLVGLELSFDKIKDVGKVALVAGIGQVVFTAAGGLALSFLLGFDFMSALFLAVALTFSSTVVVVKLLDEKHELNSLYGRIAVGIFLVQDLVVIIILTFLAGLGHSGEMNLASISLGLLKAFGGMTLLLLLVLFASRKLLPRPFAWAARSPDMLFIWGLCWCFLIVWAADAMGLSLEIGAFLAGLSLAQLPYNDDMRRRVHPLMNIFIAVFFVSLGIQMDLSAAREMWPSAVVLSLFVLLGNPLIFIFIITRMGYSRRTSFRTSVTVAQISEFSFIFAAMGVTTGLIGSDILSLTAIVGLVTIACSAYMILYSDELYRFFARWNLLKVFPDPEDGAEADKKPGFSGHIIIVGMNTMGRDLVKRLSGRGEKVLAIDTDPAKMTGLPGHQMLGNVEYLSVLEEAGLAHARLLISALQIEDTNELLAYRCRCAGIPCAINVVDFSLVDILLEQDASFLMIPKVDGVKHQIRLLEEKGFLPK